MLDDLQFLAVVPARSGSKGIPGKNLQKIGGRSLIAQAARVLSSPECAWIDVSILSTDSPLYAEEGETHGLAAPFLRPASLSNDTATAADVMLHALEECEKRFSIRYNVLLIVEPTSPLRMPSDIRRVAEAVVAGADSALTVSEIDPKFHPFKVFRLDAGKHLAYFSGQGSGITRRQQLEPLYYRNGAGYALTRDLLLDTGRVVGERASGVVVDRPVPNIDGPEDMDFANWLIETNRASLY